MSGLALEIAITFGVLALSAAALVCVGGHLFRRTPRWWRVRLSARR
jgi:hypothetical protein